MRAEEIAFLPADGERSKATSLVNENRSTHSEADSGLEPLSGRETINAPDGLCYGTGSAEWPSITIPRPSKMPL
jgi:hypothetical protein